MSKTILLIGEHCLDIWVTGTCKRLSPEAPVPVFVPTDQSTNPGMAGNVMANINSLASDWVVHFLCPGNVIQKIRHVDEQSGQQLMRIDIGDDSIDALTYDEFESKVSSETRYDAIVFSEYGKGFLSTDIMRAIAKWGKDRRIPSFADTKHIIDEWAYDITVVKINRREADAHKEEPWPHSENIIVTEGREGSYLHRRVNPGELVKIPVARTDIRCVSGAGDTYLAGLVVSYLEQGDLIKAMEFASKAATIAVSKPGVVAVKREEIT